jgi:hypothetical protein
MNVVLVMQEVLFIANSMVGESALPDFAFSSENRPKGLRISAFDELNGVFERYVVCWSQEKMDVLRHYDEGVELKSPIAAITVEGL